MYPFTIGNLYSRKDIYRIIGIDENTKGGNWDTGYNKFNNDFFIFVNIDTAGRTGHDYPNSFDSQDNTILYWFAKNNAKITHNTIQQMLNPEGNLYVFIREDSDNPKFTFSGLATAISVMNTSPVQITWQLNSPEKTTKTSIISTFIEGEKKRKTIKYSERNPFARKLCIEKYGAICQVCNFSFEKTYGELGKGFIHVHHHVPLAERQGIYIINPEKDLVPLCPNCHAMIHIKKPFLSVHDLRQLYIGNIN